MIRTRTPILALLLAMAASAEDPVAPDSAAAIAVRRLSSDDPEVRQEAREALTRLKRAALPALEEGMGSDDAEVSAVCRRLVRKLRDASIVTQGGPIPHGTPWCEARTRLVSVNFRDTSWSDMTDALEADLGYRLRIVGSGIDQDAGRTLTLQLDEVPLEFLLGTLLHRSLSEQASGLPRIGWGRNTVLFTADQKLQGDKVKTIYPAGTALRGIPPRDLEIIAEFLKRLAAEEGGDASVSSDETGLTLSASPWIQTDASMLIDLTRRAATGEPPPGARTDAAAVRAGLTPFIARWSGQSLQEVLQDLSEASGVRFEAEARIERWGLSNIYYHSRAEETAADALRGLCRGWNSIAVEQRWGAWWVFSEQMSEYQARLHVVPAREAARLFQLMDPDWDPRGVEKWISQGNRRGAGLSVSVWLPDTGLLALRATPAQAAIVRGLFEACVQESRRRQAVVDGADPPPDGPGAAQAEQRIVARLARERVTKDFGTENFQEGPVFQEVFHTLHDAMDVTTTSGAFGHNSRGNLRACRLHGVPATVLWKWLTTGDFPWYLHVDTERRSASWGLGVAQPPRGTAVSGRRVRLHEDHVEAFRALLDAWNPRVRRDWEDSPDLPAARQDGRISLPVPEAERFLATLGLGGEAPPPAPAGREGQEPEGLDKLVTWDEGKVTAEQAILKLAELADLNFILDLPREARSTRMLELSAGESRVRELLGQVLEAVGGTWECDEHGVLWIQGQRESGTVWVPLAFAARLGVEEAAAVASEFAKTGDTLWCFPATGKYLARCAGSRAGAAPAAFEVARAAAEAAAAKDAAGVAERLGEGDRAPEGYAGMLALELGSRTSAARSLELAQRLTAGGHTREALRRYRALADDPATPMPLRHGARAGTAFECARLGVTDPAMDRDAVLFGELVTGAQDAPDAAKVLALRALAEVRRRCGDVARALEACRALEELGAATPETKRWIERLESLR